MPFHRGRIVIRLDHVLTQPPPRELEIPVCRAIQQMATEELCWLVATIAKELNHRDVNTTGGA